jgi:hypothetical protein
MTPVAPASRIRMAELLSGGWPASGDLPRLPHPGDRSTARCSLRGLRGLGPTASVLASIRTSGQPEAEEHAGQPDARAPELLAGRRSSPGRVHGAHSGASGPRHTPTLRVLVLRCSGVPRRSPRSSTTRRVGTGSWMGWARAAARPCRTRPGSPGWARRASEVGSPWSSVLLTWTRSRRPPAQ